MAAAEARAAWQRAANRCFVQEDAKRAPKLACCQSSSSSSKQVDGGPAGAADGIDHPAVGFMPLNRNHPYSNLSPDTRLWLQLQPNYGYQKGLTYEQLNALEAEVETLRASIVNSDSKFSEIHQQNEGGCTYDDCDKNIESSLDVHNRVSAVCMNKDPDIRKQGVKAMYSKNSQEFIEPMDIRETYELVEMDHPGYLVSKQSDEFFDPESFWIGGEKSEPWWRTTDRDELAFLVAQKSLNHIENCDLPPPQKRCLRRDPCSRLGHFDSEKFLASSLNQNAKIGGISSPTVLAQGYSDSGGTHGGQLGSVEENVLQYGCNKTCSTTHKDNSEPRQGSESDPSKAQLLEALRHSQTRAREAEKAAKQAFDEKEHIIKLFFRQASQLFAYKQWLQLLQLENFYNQMNCKDRKPRKSWQKAAKSNRGKRGQSRRDITKYAVAFALGISLVSAGLLLGWTAGWMLPPF